MSKLLTLQNSIGQNIRYVLEGKYLFLGDRPKPLEDIPLDEFGEKVASEVVGEMLQGATDHGMPLQVRVCLKDHVYKREWSRFGMDADMINLMPDVTEVLVHPAVGDSFSRLEKVLEGDDTYDEMMKKETPFGRDDVKKLRLDRYGSVFSYRGTRCIVMRKPFKYIFHGHALDRQNMFEETLPLNIMTNSKNPLDVTMDKDGLHVTPIFDMLAHVDYAGQVFPLEADIVRFGRHGGPTINLSLHSDARYDRFRFKMDFFRMHDGEIMDLGDSGLEGKTKYDVWSCFQDMPAEIIDNGAEYDINFGFKIVSAEETTVDWMIVKPSKRVRVKGLMRAKLNGFKVDISKTGDIAAISLYTPTTRYRITNVERYS